MGHPDAAYDLDPGAQGRLLGWLFARAGKQSAAKPAEKPKGLSGDALFERVLRGR